MYICTCIWDVYAQVDIDADDVDEVDDVYNVYVCVYAYKQ